MKNLNRIVARNLAELRKNNNMTQSELAQKLNYSDKAVSKWECGESMPGVDVLYDIASLYGVSLDYLTSEDGSLSEKMERPHHKGFYKKGLIIALLSISVIWLIATVFHICFNLFMGLNLWYFYCWAVPLSVILGIIFNAIWGTRKNTFWLISILVWTLLICTCLQFLKYDIWIVLTAGIPLQIAILLWSKFQ
ncbi:MAG: hypothetical protein DBX47_01900 [Clostridiales bacterium]|nr:MAG: hypothetical protein DBX47_01900 [Clostridiales bacterium]